jgi:DNA-binding Lrp family transcriptional regulator
LSVSAFILIDVAGDHTKSAFKTITRIEGVKAVYAVTGSHDLVVFVEADTIQSLSEMVLAKIRGVDGVTKTTTSIVLNFSSGHSLPPGS